MQFRRGDAQDLPFESEIFDAVVIGFGLNHLPQPEQAFQEAFRVLRSGGRLAFTVWATPRPGEAFGIVLGAIQQHGVPNVSLPPAPPYFRFADPAEVGRVFEDTGFVAPSTRVVEQFWRHKTPDHVFDAFNEGAVRATAMLRAQPAEAREKIRMAVKAEVEQLQSKQRVYCPGTRCLIIGTQTVAGAAQQSIIAASGRRLRECPEPPKALYEYWSQLGQP